MRKMLLYISLMFLVVACQPSWPNAAPTGKPPTPPARPTIAISTSPAPAATNINFTQEPIHPKDGECLTPLVTFSYQLGDGAPGPDWHDTLPLGNWESVSMSPGFPTPLPPVEFAEYGKSGAKLEAVQTVNGKDKIWLYYETPEDYHFTYYQIDTGHWGSIKYAAKQENYFFFPRLFLGPNNSLWAAGNPTNVKGIEADTALLSVYDEVSQQFKSVVKLKDFPVFDPGKFIDNVMITNLQMDRQGNLWFFLHVSEKEKGWESQLFKFVPSNHALERHLTDFKLDYYKRGMSLVISQDDVLYLLGVQNIDVFRYDPTKGETEEIKIPSSLASNGGGDLSSLTTLFLDGDQRLWINDKGWLDLSHRDWNVIIQSPIFIVVQAGNGLWGRSQPTYSLETDDGRLWYSAYSGTGWVNPSTGQWCLFTTHPSNVVRDSDGHLWIVAAGKLYRSLFTP